METIYNRQYNIRYAFVKIGMMLNMEMQGCLGKIESFLLFVVSFVTLKK
jgi:hypothetical protein